MNPDDPLSPWNEIPIYLRSEKKRTAGGRAFSQKGSLAILFNI